MNIWRLLAVVSAWPAVALAATEDEVLASYTAYEAAVKAGDQSGALAAAERAYLGAEELWGASRADTAFIAAAYGSALGEEEGGGAQWLSGERYEKAAALFARCAEILAAAADAWPFEYASCIGNRAIMLDLAGDAEKARALYEEALSRLDALEYVDPRSEPFVAALNWRRAGAELARLEAMGAKWKRENHAAHLEGVTRAWESAARARVFLEKSGDPEMQDAIAETYFVEGEYHEVAGDLAAADIAYRAAHAMFVAKYGLAHGATVTAQHEVQRVGIEAIRKELDAADSARSARGTVPREESCRFHLRGDAEVEICPRKQAPAKFSASLLPEYQWGYVLIEYDLDDNGAVTKAVAVRSWPPEVFDRAAAKAVSKWRYLPPTTSSGEAKAVDGLRTLITFEIPTNTPVAE